MSDQVEALKRALRTARVRFEHYTQKDVPQDTTMSLLPEPVPLSIKLIVIGTPGEFYQLQASDEEFYNNFF